MILGGNIPNWRPTGWWKELVVEYFGRLFTRAILAEQAQFIAWGEKEEEVMGDDEKDEELMEGDDEEDEPIARPNPTEYSRMFFEDLPNLLSRTELYHSIYHCSSLSLSSRHSTTVSTTTKNSNVQTTFKGGLPGDFYRHQILDASMCEVDKEGRKERHSSSSSTSIGRCRINGG